MQNKCTRFCLRLDKIHHISDEDFRLINWLPTSKRVDQCINTITFKFFNDTCPYYLKEINFQNLKFLFARQSLPELIKKTDNSNTFKHNVKNYCLN